MAGMVSFKVYLSSEDDSVKEVRRFGVEVDVVTNFVYLREKLQTIFPTIRGKHFTVSWKDTDGDYVIISSDEELQIALDETASSPIRRLYVILYSEFSSAKHSTPPLNDSGPIHVGVICDSCDKQIQGFRYKCVQCPDYDLCLDCEGRGTHPEHCMIRVSVPLQWKPHYGRRLATHVNRFVKKAQHNACKEEETKQCPFKGGKHHGRNRQGHCAPSWIDTFATYLDEWANLPGECPMKETAKEAKEDDPPTSSTEAKESQNETKKSPAEHIKLISDVGLAIGENFLSQFLDPLVKIQENNDTSKTTPTSPASTSTSTPSSNEKEASPATNPTESQASAKFPGEGKKLRETVSFEDSRASATPSAPQPGTEKATADKVSFDIDEWTLLNKSESPTPTVASPVAASTGAVPKQPTAPEEASSKSIYPKLPEVPQKKSEKEPIIYHPNPTIQKAVESMVQMGFSNEGGWLTNLLISKGGDIAAALDALSPVRR